VQTFVPYPDFRASCAVLDDRRLGKQRVETFQILRALTWPTYAWKSHPAVTMWRGFVPALVEYGLESCREWTRRGYADTVAGQLLAWGPGSTDELPPWFGLTALHLSHRSALVRKDPMFYRPLFPDVPDDLPYYWPAPVFPRWPVRRGGDPVDLEGALSLLGYAQPLAGQAEAVRAAVAGRDVLLTVRPGAGASTAGLLAGLCTPGRTMWVTSPSGPLEEAPDVEVVAPRAPASVPVARVHDTAAVDPAAAAAVDEAAPTARRPGPADALAMRAEQLPTEWHFRRPDDAVPPGVGQVVLDGLSTWRRDTDVPVLAIVGGASAQRRDELTAQLRLRNPVIVGGGWDVSETWLGVQPTPSRAARLVAVRAALVARGPAVVVVATRDRASRLAAALPELRTAVWASSMRAGAATTAVGAWRSKRLDALVIPAGELPPLGRRRVPLLLHADPPESPQAWREAVALVRPAAAVLLLPADAPQDLLALGTGCVRQALLEPYGELLADPCGRCSADS
jgi:hypothetical protein